MRARRALGTGLASAAAAKTLESSMRLLFAAAMSVAAATAVAQSHPERGAARENPSRAGTVTHPPASGDASGAERAGEPEAPAPRAREPEAPQGDTAVKQQAQEQRRAALENCQTMTGESRTDCVRRADAEYRRAISNDTQSGDSVPGASLG
jgi:hypothetical protein